MQKASNDQFNGTNQSKITFAVTSGTTYKIAVDGFGATTGNIGLQWTIAAPANDNFAGPTVLAGTYGAVPATTVRSTGEPGELDYHGGAIADNSVWYTWTPTYERARRSCGCATSRVASHPASAVYTGTSLGALTSVGSGATSATFNASRARRIASRSTATAARWARSRSSTSSASARGSTRRSFANGGTIDGHGGR